MAYNKLDGCEKLKLINEGNIPPNVTKENQLNVQLTMFRYNIQLDESDIIYNIFHEEVLDEYFSPKQIINKMITVWKIWTEEKGDRFMDKQLTSYVKLMLEMTSVPGQNTKIKKHRMKKHTFEQEAYQLLKRQL